LRRFGGSVINLFRRPEVNQGLRLKIIFSCFSAFLLLILLLAFYFLANLESILLLENKQALRENSLLIRAMINDHFPGSFSSLELDRYVDELSRESRFRVSVIDPKGKLIADSELSAQALEAAENHRERPEILQVSARGEGWGRRLSVTTHKPHLYYAIPLHPNQRKGAVLRLAVFLEILQKIKIHVIRSGVLVLGGILVISTGASILISRWIVYPVREMCRVADQFAEQDFSEKLYITSKDELGHLAAALNEMAGKLDFQLKELAREKGQLETVLANMSEGVLVTSRTREIFLMNPAFKILFQSSMPETAKTVLEHLRNIAIEDALKEAVSRGHEIRREILLDRKPPLILEMAASPLVVQGQIEGAVAVFHNITAIRRAESEMRDFIQNASHELRTPLSVVKGYLEALLEDAAIDKPVAKEYLEVMSRNTERLEYLISDIMDLSKIEGGKIEIERTPLVLKDAAGRLLDDFSARVADKKVVLVNSIPAGLPPALIGEFHFSQVLGNLVDNAIKYSGENSAVTVNAHSEKNSGFVILSVKDEGIGIPEAELSRIFERFYRVDKARSRASGGTGLGLSIVKFLVEAYGGTVSVESKVGAGSTFYFSLPVASAG